MPRLEENLLLEILTFYYILSRCRLSFLSRNQVFYIDFVNFQILLAFLCLQANLQILSSLFRQSRQAQFLRVKLAEHERRFSPALAPRPYPQLSPHRS